MKKRTAIRKSSYYLLQAGIVTVLLSTSLTGLGLPLLDYQSVPSDEHLREIGNLCPENVVIRGTGDSTCVDAVGFVAHCRGDNEAGAYVWEHELCVEHPPIPALPIEFCEGDDVGIVLAGIGICTDDPIELCEEDDVGIVLAGRGVCTDGEHFNIDGLETGGEVAPEHIVVEEIPVVVPPIETLPTCELDPCDDSTTVFGGLTITVPGVPSQDVGTPEIRIPETCAPIVICLGPIVIDEQNLTQVPGTEDEDVTIPPVIVPPVCEEIPEICLGPLEVFPGFEEETPRIEETTPAVGIHVSVDDVEGFIDPIGPPIQIGPITVTVPNPFGADIPVTLCPEGCPIPATTGDVSLQTEITVTVWAGNEFHSETVPVDLEPSAATR